MRSLLDLSAATYVHHFLHDDDRDWPETNCYVDLWIETIHALGLDPLPGLAFTLGSGFDGEQWEFFKHPDEDLRELYGIDVREMNVWRSLTDHVVLQLDLGNLLTVEVDAFHLPDTAGVSYGIGHQKTSIVPQMIDPESERLGYFHNRSYHELEGADFRAVMRVGAPAELLVPYVELVDLGRLQRRDDDELRRLAAAMAARSLAQRRPGNPVRGLADRVQADLPWLQANPDLFHAYAFGTLRQLGAWASTAAAFVRWFDVGLADAAEALDVVSRTAKTSQFKLARVLNGRSVDLGALFDGMVDSYALAFDRLEDVFGG